MTGTLCTPSRRRSGSETPYRVRRSRRLYKKQGPSQTPVGSQDATPRPAGLTEPLPRRGPSTVVTSVEGLRRGARRFLVCRVAAPTVHSETPVVSGGWTVPGHTMVKEVEDCWTLPPQYRREFSLTL